MATIDVLYQEILNYFQWSFLKLSKHGIIQTVTGLDNTSCQNMACSADILIVINHHIIDQYFIGLLNHWIIGEDYNISGDDDSVCPLLVT